MSVLLFCALPCLSSINWFGNFTGNDVVLSNAPPFFGKNAFFISSSQGNDATGTRGQAALPFATLSNAWVQAFLVTSNPVFVLAPEVITEVTAQGVVSDCPILNGYNPTIIAYGATVLFSNATDNGVTFTPALFNMLGAGPTNSLTIRGGTFTTGPQVTNNAARFIYYGNTGNGFTNYLRDVEGTAWVADCLHGTSGTHTSFYEWFNLTNCSFTGSFDLFTGPGGNGSLFGANAFNCTFYASTNNAQNFLSASNYFTTPRGITLTKGFFTWINCHFYGDAIGASIGSSSTNAFVDCSFGNLVGTNFNSAPAGAWVVSSATAATRVDFYHANYDYTNVSIPASGTLVWHDPMPTNPPTAGNSVYYDGLRYYFAPSGTSQTNISSVVATNFVSGLVYTNSSGGNQIIHGTAGLTVAAVTGYSFMGLMVNNQSFALWTTNDAAKIVTSASSIAGLYYQSLNTTVTNGQVYTFTNTSSGAGNSSTVAAMSGSSGTVTTIP